MTWIFTMRHIDKEQTDHTGQLWESKSLINHMKEIANQKYLEDMITNDKYHSNNINWHREVSFGWYALVTMKRVSRNLFLSLRLFLLRSFTFLVIYDTSSKEQKKTWFMCYWNNHEMFCVRIKIGLLICANSNVTYTPKN